MEDTREFKFKYPLHHYTANMVYLRGPTLALTYELWAVTAHAPTELLATYADEREANAAHLRAYELILAARSLAGVTP